MSRKRKRSMFLVRNLIKGFLWLALIITIYLLIKTKTDLNYLNWLKPVFDMPIAMLFIFLSSELLFGIIPPELFMIWATEFFMLYEYILIILLLAILSYLSGVAGYYFGRYLNSTMLYKYVRKKFLRKYERLLNNHGAYLIIVASVTPVPYSGICMLTGAVKYPVKKFLLYSLFRFARFFVYSWLIWEAILF